MQRSCLYRCLVTLFDPSWRATPVREPPPAPDAWLPATELLTASSPNGQLRLVAKGGHNDEPHNHLDVGSVVLSAGGDPVLIDVGTGQYSAASFSTGRYATWFTQSQYHCVPEVDSVAQGVGARFRAEVLAQAGRQLTLDLASAYPAAAGITSWHRSLALDEKLQVTEEWELDRAGRQVRLHLMLARVPEPAEDGSWLLRGPSGTAQAVLTVAGLTTATSAVIPGEPTATHGAPATATSAVEPIDLTDPILHGVWGDHIARLTLTVADAPARGGLTWSVRAL